MIKKNLIFRAGPSAYRRIRDGGLSPNDVDVMVGAAGGPKWLILGHLDRALFGQWFRGRTQPLHMVGSSAGAWRFAVACHPDGGEAIDRFEQAYIHQYYSARPTPEEISLEAVRIIATVMGNVDPKRLLSHPFLRPHVMTVRCKGMTAAENIPVQLAGFAAAALLNHLSRKSLSLFFERVWFYDPRSPLPADSLTDIRTTYVALTPQNIFEVLSASGAIPLMMKGVKDIPGAPVGIYRDGGIVDYHFHQPFDAADGIVLYPHFLDRVIPGWLDKRLPSRSPAPQFFDNMLRVTPSATFLKRLPHGKIPDRTDFKRFLGNDPARVTYWQRAADMGKILADEWMETVLSGRIRQRVELWRGRV